MIGRRGLLRGGLGAIGALAASPAAMAFARAPVRRLAFNNLHTGENLDIVYWENGVYIPDCLDAVNGILRDWRANEIFAIEPALLDLLSALQVQLDTPQPFAIVSGYRSPATNAMLRAHSGEVAGGSLHMVGQAIDICMDDVDNAVIHAAALELGVGGVGYYPQTGFVHVDVGPVRTWQGT